MKKAINFMSWAMPMAAVGYGVYTYYTNKSTKRKKTANTNKQS